MLLINLFAMYRNGLQAVTTDIMWVKLTKIV